MCVYICSCLGLHTCVEQVNHEILRGLVTSLVRVKHLLYIFLHIWRGFSQCNTHSHNHVTMTILLYQLHHIHTVVTQLQSIVGHHYFNRQVLSTWSQMIAFWRPVAATSIWVNKTCVELYVLFWRVACLTGLKPTLGACTAQWTWDGHIHINAQLCFTRVSRPVCKGYMRS